MDPLSLRILGVDIDGVLIERAQKKQSDWVSEQREVESSKEEPTKQVKLDPSSDEANEDSDEKEAEKERYRPEICFRAADLSRPEGMAVVQSFLEENCPSRCFFVSLFG